MDARKHVVLVEDDAHIAETLRLHLHDEGFRVEWAADGTSGLRALEAARCDALILDLMLPGIDGLEICRRVRAMAHYVPIIIVSARASEAHRIIGLELGADDYLAKPFSMLELVARVRALMRRVEAVAREMRLHAGTIEFEAMRIDPAARECSVDGRAVELKPREFDLLYYFAGHPGMVCSRAHLLNRVWGCCHDGYEHTVNTHINRVRAKIEPDPAAPRRIVTVWGMGYKFVPPGNAPGAAAATAGAADIAA